MRDAAATPLTLRFRPQGMGRLVEALFLVVWLLGWALGELLALALLRHPPKALSLTKVIHDPSVPRALGLWLARQTRVPFHDRVPSEAERLAEREAELNRLRDQLARSGRAGRWLLGALERTVGPRDLQAEAPRRPQQQVQQRSTPSASGRSAPETRSADGSLPRSPGGG